MKFAASSDGETNVAISYCFNDLVQTIVGALPVVLQQVTSIGELPDGV
jgi:hypothetical protein